MPQVHVIDIDPRLPLREQPHTGHNRWHEAVPPILEVDSGDTVVYGTRSGSDGQVRPESGSDDIAGFDRTRVHPLTGPVAVRGAVPGDVVAVDILAIEPDPWEQRGFTMCTPRIGFLGDGVTDTLVHWELHGTAFAESPQLPGVRIPAAPFPGTLGVAPSAAVRESAATREAAFHGPEPAGAVPGGGIVAEQGLRTLPPRENGGNLDVKLAGVGTTMLLPVLVDGALVSVGDVHFAQGDGEACGTAIEMSSRVHLRLRLVPGGMRSPGGAAVRFERSPQAGTQPGSGRAFFATSGIAAASPGEGGDALERAARDALEAMIEYLCSRDFDRMQAYIICSVAVDLRISQLVNTPTVGVTAVLPLGIFV